MTAIVTAEEMEAAEARAIAEGITETDLMRRAGEAVAEWIDGAIVRDHQRHAIALVGKGNNGGDAIVALASLHERGWKCSSVWLGRDAPGVVPATPDSVAAIHTVLLDALGEADVILDGVLGIHGRLELSAEIVEAFTAAGDARLRHRVPLVALDVPSGVDATTGAASADAFRADVTLCLGMAKRGLFREPAASHCGELVILPFGVDETRSSSQETLITASRVNTVLPRRSASAHKSDTGTVLIIGGTPQYYGAPRLAAEAALRSGAGLVALAIPEQLIPVIASQLPETVFIGLTDSATTNVERLGTFVQQRKATLQSIVIGPGLGRGEYADILMRQMFDSDQHDSLKTLVPDCRIVIDADALNWLSGRSNWPTFIDGRSAVLTPHVGEIERLFRVDRQTIMNDPLDFAARAARESGQVVVLKAGIAAVASPNGGVQVAPRATPELATAGTGDVLAGMIGALLAQGMEPLDAAVSAVWIGAIAGRMASDSVSYMSVIARDVISNIGGAMSSLVSPRWTE